MRLTDLTVMLIAYFRRSKIKLRDTLFLCIPLCVGYDLFFRAVSSQVFSALQSLTSVFGMGTGGPFALKTLTFSELCSQKTEQRMKVKNETQVFQL